MNPQVLFNRKKKRDEALGELLNQLSHFKQNQSEDPITGNEKIFNKQLKWYEDYKLLESHFNQTRVPGREDKQEKELTDSEKEEARQLLEKSKQNKEDEVKRLLKFNIFMNTRKKFYVSTKQDINTDDLESEEVKRKLKNFKTMIRDLISF